MNLKEAMKNVADVPNKYNSAGGNINGDITLPTDSVIQWNRNTDYAKISFKNDSDEDTDSYMSFLVGDNGNEYFKFASVGSTGTTNWLTIGSDHLRFRGEAVYHTGHRPTPADIGAAQSSHWHDFLGPAGSWSTNGAVDLLVNGKRALVGETNGRLHLGYGGDFSSILCGNGYTVWHSGNFDPNSKSNNHDHPYISTSASCNRNWHWSGQGGQPSWLWGGNDGDNMYVYDPSNFRVNYANAADYANSAGYAVSAGNSSQVGGKTIFVQQGQPYPNAVGDIWISW